MESNTCAAHNIMNRPFSDNSNGNRGAFLTSSCLLYGSGERISGETHNEFRAPAGTGAEDGNAAAVQLDQ